MKENTESINQIIFTHFPSNQTESYTRRNLRCLIFSSLKKKAFLLREYWLNGAATLGIGTVLLATIYLFFIQLAEYGWK